MGQHYQAKIRKLILTQLEQGASLEQLTETWKENMESPLEGTALFIAIAKIELDKKLVHYFHEHPDTTKTLSLFKSPEFESPEQTLMMEMGLPRGLFTTSDQHFIEVCSAEQERLFLDALNGKSIFTRDSRLRWYFFSAITEADPDELEALLFRKFEEAKKRDGFKTLRNYANRQREDFSQNFKDALDSCPIALQWIDLLKEVGEGRITIEEQLLKAETSKPLQEIENSLWVEEEPKPSDVILDAVSTELEPVKDRIQRKGEYDKVVKWLCAYFEDEPFHVDLPVFVKTGSKVKVAQALGRIYRRLENVEPMGFKYQRAVVPMFDCFTPDIINSKDPYGTTLYAYLTRKAK